MEGVVAINGAAPERAQVRLLRRDMYTEILSANVDAAGRYTVSNVGPAQYMVLLEWRTSDWSIRLERGYADVREDQTTTVNLSVQSSGSIHGHLAFPSSYERASVLVLPESDRDPVTSRGIEWETRDRAVAFAGINSSGPFEINQLPPGSYRLVAIATNFGPNGRLKEPLEPLVVEELVHVVDDQPATCSLTIP